MLNTDITLQRTNTILYCRHWSQTVRFYTEKMQLPIAFANEWFVEYQLTDSSFLSIANSARATIADVQGQGVTLTWEVQDLAAVKEQLTRQGIATTAIQHKWGALVFYCQDPEGHRLEFWADHNSNKDGLSE